MEDDALLPDLTAMQRVGVRYHREFMQRVPRAKSAECEALVKTELLAVLRQQTGVDERSLAQRLHVRVVGSYLRGR